MSAERGSNVYRILWPRGRFLSQGREHGVVLAVVVLNSARRVKSRAIIDAASLLLLSLGLHSFCGSISYPIDLAQSIAYQPWYRRVLCYDSHKNRNILRRWAAYILRTINLNVVMNCQGARTYSLSDTHGISVHPLV